MVNAHSTQLKKAVSNNAKSKEEDQFDYDWDDEEDQEAIDIASSNRFKKNKA
jgi:hypothetical protein